MDERSERRSKFQCPSRRHFSIARRSVCILELLELLELLLFSVPQKAVEEMAKLDSLRPQMSGSTSFNF